MSEEMFRAWGDNPEPIMGVNAEPSRDEYDLRLIWPEDPKKPVYVNPDYAAGEWHSYAYRSDDSSPPKAANPDWDMPDDYLMALYYSGTFECFYTYNPARDESDYRLPQQAAWWLAQQRVPLSEWPDLLLPYVTWAAENLAGHEVPLDQWPKGLEAYAPYYAYNLSDECEEIHTQAVRLLHLCERLAGQESSSDRMPELSAIGTRLEAAADLLREAQTYAYEHLL